MLLDAIYPEATCRLESIARHMARVPIKAVRCRMQVRPCFGGFDLRQLMYGTLLDYEKKYEAPRFDRGLVLRTDQRSRRMLGRRDASLRRRLFKKQVCVVW